MGNTNTNNNSTEYDVDYKAQTENLIPDGVKKIRYSNDDVYEGQVNGNNPCGQGVLKYKNGDVFTGEFKKFRPYKGELKYADGRTFVGELENRHSLTRGVITFKSGDPLGKNLNSTGSRVKIIFQ